MFEILKALMALQEACDNHGAEFVWDNLETEGRWVHGLQIRTEIGLTEADFEFVQQARQMFAVAE